VKVQALRTLFQFLLVAIVVLVFGDAIATAQIQAAGLRPIRSWDREYLGPSARAWSISQASTGHIFVGANSLLSFDGDRWREVSINSGYAIRALDISPSDRLWIGAMDEVGYIDRDDTGWENYRSLTSSLPSELLPIGEVWHVFSDDRGATFVTRTHVLRWESGAWSTWAFPGSRRMPASRVGGRIWFHHADSGLWVMDTKGPSLQIPASDIPSSFGLISVVKADSTGLLLASGAGLHRYHNGIFERWSLQGSDFLNRHNGTAIIALRDGRLALGTLSGGLGLLSADGESLEIINRTNGLSSDAVISLFVDRDEMLWAGLFTHVVAIETKNDVRLFTPKVGLPESSVNAVTLWRDELYIATDDGLHRWNESRFESVPSLSGRHDDILGTSHGLIAGGYRVIDALTSEGPAKVRQFAHGINRIVPTSQPHSWLLGETYNLGQLEHSSDEGWTHKTLAILPDTITSVLEENPDSIWAGTQSKGLFRLSRGSSSEASWSLVPSSFDGTTPSAKGPTFVAEVESYVVALAPSGGFSYDKDQRRFFPIRGMPRSQIFAHSRPDPRHRVWVAINSTLERTSASVLIGYLALNEENEVSWTEYPVRFTSVLGHIRRMYADEHGLIWIAGDKALMSIAPSAEARVQAPRTPGLTSTTPNGSVLPYHHSPIRIEFSTQDYTRRDQLRYQYLLRGIDRDWSAPTNDPHVVYSGLREGRYDLQVRTVDLLGRISEPAVWAFEVQPPWYRTIWTYSALTLTAVLAFLLGVRLRQTQLIRQAQKLQLAVDEKTSELAKANAAKTEFIANMSHEIRHPISGILGLSVALEDSPLNSDQLKSVRSIKSCGYLLGKLVDDVLEFAKFEVGKTTLEITLLKPIDLIENCAAILRRAATDARCTLRIEADAASYGTFQGDAGRIQQILFNFLTNAFKFAPGTEVQIGSYRERNGNIRIYVQDHGPGISDEDAKVLFTKFTRLKSARDGHIRGSGLGLALCRLLAQSMGGDVHINSQAGRGSRFSVSLPLAEVSTKASPELPRLGTSLRALVVDDIDYAGSATAAVLRRLGFETTLAHDGPSAIERWASNSFDVVLLDLELSPTMNGVDLAKALRSRQRPHHRATVIAASAHASPIQKQFCLDQGFDGYVTKPITPEKLSEVLSTLPQPLRPPASVEAPPPPLPTMPSVNLRLIEELAGTEPEAFSRQLARFCQEVDSELRALATADLETNWRESARLAHRLANYFQMIDAVELTEMVKRLETDAPVLTAEIRAKILSEISSAWQILQNHLSQARPSTATA